MGRSKTDIKNGYAYVLAKQMGMKFREELNMDRDTKNIILIFPTYNSLRYWFNYIRNYSLDNEIEIKVYNITKMMYYKNAVIYFVIKEENIYPFLLGRRNIKLYSNAENDFELNFEYKLKEILSEGEINHGEKTSGK